MSRRDFKFEATKLHFEDLAQRYGNPIIILNLIKVIFFRIQSIILTFRVQAVLWFFLTLPPCIVCYFYDKQTFEKRPREMILRAEFANAIEFLNKDLPEDERLRFLHWDINKRPRMYIVAASSFHFIFIVGSYFWIYRTDLWVWWQSGISLTAKLKWPCYV